MPLPKIATPKYAVTVPSTKKQTTFRPFLMKEQKVLMMALESKSNDDMFRAMCDILTSCVDGVDDPNNMPLFDVEYLFTKVRSKSIGEVIDVRVGCPSCNKKTEIEINLDQLEVVFPENITNKIMLTDKMGIILKYPSLHDAVQNMNDVSSSGVVSFICDSIEGVFDEDQVWGKKDFTKEEIIAFVESMSTGQFEKVTEFYRNIPQLSKTAKCTCMHCSHEFEINFKGLQDFFT